MTKILSDATETNPGVLQGSATKSTTVPVNLTRTGVIFDGSDDYITFGQDPVNMNGTDWSWSLWFKTTDTSFRLLDHRGTGAFGSSRGVQISSTNGSTWSNTGIDDGVGGTGESVTFSGATFNEDDDKWHHLVLTWDTSVGTGVLYIDGAVADTQTNANMIGANLQGAASHPLTAGRESNGTAHAFAGSLSDIRIYSETLTADDVADLYAGREIDRTNLSAWWPLDDGEGTTARDVFDTNDGTLTNFDETSYGSTRYESGLSERTSLGDLGASFAESGTYTYSAWIRTDGGLSGTEYIFSEASTSDNNPTAGLQILASGNFQTRIKNNASSSADVDSGIAVDDSAWHHVAATCSGSGGTIRTYVDGVAGATGTHPGGTVSINNAGIAALARLSWLNHYDGWIRDLKIYSSELSADQVNELAGHPDAEVNGVTADHHWKLDERGGTTAYDRAGSVDGTHQNTPTFSPSAWIQASDRDELEPQSLSLDDSTSDYVSVADDATLDGFTAFTASAWVRPDTTGEAMTILEKGDAWSLKVNSSDQIEAMVDTGTPATATSSGTLSADTWYHVALHYDGSTITIYIDGSSDGTQAKTGTVATNTSDLTIGENGTDSFSGLIDDVRLYDAAINSADVAALADGEDFRGALVSMWRFNEGTTPRGNASNLAKFARRLLYEDCRMAWLGDSLSAEANDPRWGEGILITWPIKWKGRYCPGTNLAAPDNGVQTFSLSNGAITVSSNMIDGSANPMPHTVWDEQRASNTAQGAGPRRWLITDLDNYIGGAWTEGETIRFRALLWDGSTTIGGRYRVSQNSAGADAEDNDYTSEAGLDGSQIIREMDIDVVHPGGTDSTWDFVIEGSGSIDESTGPQGCVGTLFYIPSATHGLQLGFLAQSGWDHHDHRSSTRGDKSYTQTGQYSDEQIYNYCKHNRSINTVVIHVINDAPDETSTSGTDAAVAEYKHNLEHVIDRWRKQMIKAARANGDDIEPIFFLLTPWAALADSSSQNRADLHTASKQIADERDYVCSVAMDDLLDNRYGATWDDWEATLLGDGIHQAQAGLIPIAQAAWEGLLSTSYGLTKDVVKPSPCKNIAFNPILT